MKANRNRQATLPHDQDNGNSLKEEHHHPDWKTTTRRAVPADQTTQPREAANADLSLSTTRSERNPGPA